MNNLQNTFLGKFNAFFGSFKRDGVAVNTYKSNNDKDQKMP